MARPDKHKILTETGPGTPMGNLFRRYWFPAMLSEELPEPDCPPVRLKLLSERLIAFRDSEGRLGLMDEFCAHRGVSLWFGRNEASGLRCPYHGWKYDVNGNCLEVPSEPIESGFCKRIKLKSYPLHEAGGVIWVYMGPPDLQPPVPDFEWMSLPKEHRYIAKRWQECNWLQAMEGGIDSSHVSFLHSGELHTDPLHRSTKGAEYQGDRMPKFEVVETPGGLLIGARRNADPGYYYWRVTQWILPSYTMIPPYGDNALNGHSWVPMDDENCIVWGWSYHSTRPLSAEELDAMENGQGMHVQVLPGTFRPVINKDNDYLMNRAAQKAGLTFSGVSGIAMQDASVQESMGVIQDRTKENLASTDNAIILARHRLRKLALALQDGVEPPGTGPENHRVRSASFVLPADARFREARADALIARPGLPHTGI